MIILIDIGNTRIKWAIAQASKHKNNSKKNSKDNTSDSMDISEGQAVNYTSENYEQVLAELIDNWQELDIKPSRVIVSNVGEQDIVDELDNHIWESFQIEPEYLKAGRKFKHLKNGYLKPGLLGVDRWLNLVGAYILLKNTGELGAYCVIDCGTAITVDVVDSNGQHLGGFITPGVKLMQHSLLEKSEVIKNNLLAKPRRSKSSSPKNEKETSKTQDKPNQYNAFLANNTKQAIEGGIYYSVVAYLERIVTDIVQNLNTNCKVFLTGGDSVKLAAVLNLDNTDMIDDVEYNHELIWQGMLGVI